MNTIAKDWLGFGLLKQLGACKLSVGSSTADGRIKFSPVIWAFYAVHLCERLVGCVEVFLHLFRETVHSSSLPAARGVYFCILFQLPVRLCTDVWNLNSISIYIHKVY
jgi:hypothetical protein